jgi:hypothetical protein
VSIHSRTAPSLSFSYSLFYRSFEIFYLEGKEEEEELFGLFPLCVVYTREKKKKKKREVVHLVQFK